MRGWLAPVLFIAGLAWGAEETNSITNMGDTAAVTTSIPLRLLNQRHQTDLDDMLKRGLVRVAVTYSKTHYFLDKGGQYGLTPEVLSAFEKHLRKRFHKRNKTGSLSVVAIPMARDELIPAVVEGRADLAVANLTITPERQQQVDFSIPSMRDVKELVVSRRDTYVPDSLDELSGMRIMVRPSSSYYSHLVALNESLTARGYAPIEILPADEHLETEDLLEMVNADLIDLTIADSHLAHLWAEIFTNIQVHETLILADDGDIAWAMRKHSPKLMAEVNTFLKAHRQGTLFGNVLLKRYLQNPDWARKALEANELARFNQVAGIFRQYAGQYDFNYLMLLAQGYQESQLNHDTHSKAGAIGIMQLMPTTGKLMRVGDIRQLDANVHAGTKYLRLLVDTYFNEPGINQTNRLLFAFAAYNAGPSRIQKMRRKTEKMGLNPNVWFGNVEHLVAANIGRETVQYVANISKYYVAYRMIMEQERIKQSLGIHGSR